MGHGAWSIAWGNNSKQRAAGRNIFVSCQWPVVQKPEIKELEVWGALRSFQLEGLTVDLSDDDVYSYKEPPVRNSARCGCFERFFLRRRC